LYLSCTTHFALEFSHFYTTLVCTAPHQATLSLNIRRRRPKA
jgi:hypothetical protein